MGFWPYIIGFIYFPLLVSYIAILQRKRLTRKNLRKTFEEAKADYKLHPWIYYFAYLLTFPFVLLSIMIWTNVPLSEEVKEDKPEKKTYTPEDLLERISRANVILGELIKTYVEATQTINHIPAIDERLEELSL
jgi:hypothetical protein